MWHTSYNITDCLWERFYRQKLVVAHFIIREFSCHRGDCVSEIVDEDVTPSCIISLYMVHRLYLKKKKDSFMVRKVYRRAE